MMNPFRFLVAAGLAVGGAGVAMSAADAGTPCGPRVLSAPFTQFGDTNQYFRAPNGDFESANWEGTNEHGWGNEPWRINGAGHSRSLKVTPGKWSISETFCVTGDERSIRLFVKRPGVIGARLTITVIAGSTTTPTLSQVYTINGDQFGWTPTPALVIPSSFDVHGEQWMAIKVWTSGSNATWHVDDVMVDPWKVK